jgi:hypothetical protein
MTLLQLGQDIEFGDEKTFKSFLEKMLHEDNLVKDENETVSIGNSVDDDGKFSIYTLVYKSDTQTYFIRTAVLNDTRRIAKLSVYSD